MKKIEAIITSFKLDEVQDALRHVGLSGMTVSEVRTAGGSNGQKGFYRGAQYAVEFHPKIKVELLVADDKVAACAAAIERTANAGDVIAEISVSTVDDVIRIRTGEHGVHAI